MPVFGVVLTVCTVQPIGTLERKIILAMRFMMNHWLNVYMHMLWFRLCPEIKK